MRAVLIFCVAAVGDDHGAYVFMLIEAVPPLPVGDHGGVFECTLVWLVNSGFVALCWWWWLWWWWLWWWWRA